MDDSKDVFLLVGLGSIGKRHLANLMQLRPKAKILVFNRTKYQSVIGKSTNISYVDSIDVAIKYQPQAAIVASPAVFHLAQVMLLLKNNISVLVEKPLSNDLEGIENVVQLANQTPAVLMVGYTLRFNPIIKQAKIFIDKGVIGKLINVVAICGQYLPSWRPHQDYKQTVSAKQELGGGVLLELSHEFDYLRWIVGDIKSLVADVRSSGQLDIDVEDRATILLKFEQDITGVVHLDFLQKVPQRVVIINGNNGRINCDLIAGRLVINQHNTEPLVFDYGEEDKNNMYLAELACFLDCVSCKTQPPITAIDGLLAVKVVEAIRHSARCSQWTDIQ